MRTLIIGLLFVLIFAFEAMASSLKPEDFRPALPSRAKLSYDVYLSRYPAQRIHLFWDKKLNYHLYAYVITRDMIKDEIQRYIDAAGIRDRQKIQEIINYYIDITPQEREAIVVLYFKAPGISNRYFINRFVNFEDFVYLEYGSKEIQKHVEQARERMRKQRRDYPSKEEVLFKAGKRPVYLDVESDYLYYPEKIVLADQQWDPLVNAYRWVFAFRFSDEDLARIEELLLNDIDVTFSLVVSDPKMFAYKPFPKPQQYQILKAVDEEFVEFMESIGELSPKKTRTKIKKKFWIKY